MYAQEQLAGVREVVVEALKPLNDKIGILDKKVDEGFESMNQKMEEGFESHAEQIAKVSEQVSDLQGDVSVICKNIEKLQLTTNVTRHKLATLEENRPALFMSR